LDISASHARSELLRVLLAIELWLPPLRGYAIRVRHSNVTKKKRPAFAERIFLVTPRRVELRLPG
jgi:hypothetical protein